MASAIDHSIEEIDTQKGWLTTLPHGINDWCGLDVM